MRNTSITIGALTLLAGCQDATAPTQEISAARAFGGEYVVVELPTLPGGSMATAHAINARGQVVGASNSAASLDVHATRWTRGQPEDLGTLGGLTSEALDINNHGDVVGSAEIASRFRDAHPFRLRDEGGMEDLGTFAPGGHGGANAINDNGVVVGWSLTAIGPQHAFRWTAEAGMRDLGTIPTSHESVALDVNNRGEIVGYATWADGIGAIPLLWTKDGDLIRLPVLPAGGDFICAPVAINERGNAVGLSDGLFEPAHATLWTAAHEVMDLGTLPGSSGIRAYGINDAGTVVGLSYWPGSQLRAFVWTRGGGMRELPGLPGATRTIARAINNAGTVVGESGGSAWSRAVEWVRSSSPAAGRTP